MAGEVTALKQFLFAHMYRHPHVMRSMNNAKDVVTALFEVFADDPHKLPADWAKACGDRNDARTVSVVRDYIAGMTDNYALREYARVFHKEIVL
jgi:dGTPase